jgi:hypothetical protein
MHCVNRWRSDALRFVPDTTMDNRKVLDAVPQYAYGYGNHHGDDHRRRRAGVMTTG